MDDRSQSAFSSLLKRARQGDEAAVGDLFSLVYDQLKRIARVQRMRQNEETLNTTALVHEAFIKLSTVENLGVQDRAHFLAVAATAMRQSASAMRRPSSNPSWWRRRSRSRCCRP